MNRLAPLVVALTLAAPGARAAGPAEGVWLTQAADAKVRIGPCPAAPAKLCGAIVWLKAPRDETGQLKHDAHNPDPTQRARPLIGLAMIRDFEAAGAGRWDGGKIYDPRSGKTYASKIQISADGRLKVAGCVAIVCKTQIWTRSAL
jgi:uncharacterized protein (DUF2147 family)